MYHYFFIKNQTDIQIVDEKQLQLSCYGLICSATRGCCAAMADHLMLMAVDRCLIDTTWTIPNYHISGSFDPRFYCFARKHEVEKQNFLSAKSLMSITSYPFPFSVPK